MSPVFPFSLALYAASCALYLAQLVSPGGPGAPPSLRLGWVARVVLALGFLSQTVDIGYLCVQGSHPFANAREVMAFTAWITVGAFLSTTLRFSLPLAGALIVPVTLVLNLAAHLGPSPQLPDHAQTFLATLHIGLASAGVAVFAVAAGDSAVYLFAEGRLKVRRARSTAASAGAEISSSVPPSGPGLLSGLPSLEALDTLNRRCIQLGFPLFTVAMVTGALWLMRLPESALAHQHVHRLLQPQYALSVVAWAIYAGLLLLRLTAGWRGRRAAVVTLGGFAASLGVVAIYYVRGILGGG